MNIQRVHYLILLVLLTVVAVILAGCTQYTGGTGGTPSPTTPPVQGVAGIPPEVTQYAKDWPLPHHDYANTRATMDSAINSGNVKTLGAAWVHTVPSGASTFGSISTTPIIMGTTVFVTDLGNNFMALDLDTGSLKWQTIDNLANLGPNGATVGNGKVFGSAGPYEVVALDMNTGKEIWRTNLASMSGDNSGIVGIDIQGMVYDDLYYTSTVPGNAGVFYAGGAEGVIFALDEATGTVVWSARTLDTTDYWGNASVNSGGGCWFPPAIDTKTGTIFFGIANPAPFPGQAKGPGISQDYPNGISRPGDNLYTDSMMALDHKTGVMKWYTQVWPHDISDYDLQQAPILATATVNGTLQEIVLGTGKMGRVYAFNRETGDLLWETAVGDHMNDTMKAFPLDGTMTILPGILGGVETPMAYADSVVYVAANNLATDMINGLTFTLHPLDEATGDLVAIDVNTGRILWDNRINSGLYGGATVVNDLVFTGTFDGMLYAFKRDTGEQVWSYQAPAAVNAWPAVSGDTIVWPIAGPGGQPSIIGFSLGSTSPAVTIVQPKNGSSQSAGDVTVTVVVSNFNLADKLGQANVAGEGHLHYFLDVAAPTTPGKPAIPPAGSTWAATADTTHTFTNVTPGTHTISVELVNNDHTPLNPPVVSTISVTTDIQPRITISSPTNGQIVRTGNLTISTEVENFILADKLGQANVAGEGHIHYFMDTPPVTSPGKPAIPPAGSVWAPSADSSHTFISVPVGIHHFSVELVNNDHTPLDPPVTAEIQTFVITYTGGLGGQ